MNESSSLICFEVSMLMTFLIQCTFVFLSV